MNSLLVAFDEANISCCRQLRVPTAALLYASEGIVGIFVHKETSARPSTSTTAMHDKPTFWPFSSVAKPTILAEKFACTWPATLESGPYRWVPVRVERVNNADELNRLGLTTVWYDSECNGVGKLDASRIVSHPDVALDFLRKRMQPVGPSSAPSAATDSEIRAAPSAALALSEVASAKPKIACGDDTLTQFV